MKLKFTLLLMTFVFAMSTTELPAQSNGKNKITKCDLQSGMRQLWEDHIQWTRNVILNVMDDLPGTTEAVNRLLQNQDDIGNAIKPFYGDAAGSQLSSLLRQHITIAADLLVALKNNNTTAFNAANAQWVANADDISVFLSAANPNWPLIEMKQMMYAHLNQTAAEALARKNQNYNADVAAYEKVHFDIIHMADMLTEGLIAQFPNKFSGCTIKESNKITPCGLKSDMRKLWEDHITWTRNVIFNVLDNLPGTTEAVNRLLQNQVDLGNAVKGFYGTAAGAHLTVLLNDHITIAATLLTALKNNDATGLTAANAQWYVNADSIAKFLSTINHLWSYPEMKAMMFEHLDLTTMEALARKNGDYAVDVTSYANVHLAILEMADMLTEGITKQFPNKFTGCPLSMSTHGHHARLDQNVPNPFVSSTTIRFFIPHSTNKAQLIIFDQTGLVVKTYHLTQRGEGTVSFESSGSKKGMLTYSIILDGKIAETRKMIR